MRKRKALLLRSLEILGFAVAAVSGFLNNFAAPEIATSARYQTGLLLFLCLIVLLTIAALASPKSRVWTIAGGAAFILAIPPSFLYPLAMARYTWESPGDPEKHLRGSDDSDFTDPVKEYLKEQPDQSASPENLALRFDLNKIWKPEAIERAGTTLLALYRWLVVSLATSVFCLLEANRASIQSQVSTAATSQLGLRLFRVFLASPSDVLAERNAAERVIAELNKTVAKDCGIVLESVRWEVDSIPGWNPDGVQAKIESDTRFDDVDMLIGILWARLGTAGPDGQTGTEREIRRAMDLRRTRGDRPEIMLYFSSSPLSPGQDAEQLLKVRCFRAEFTHQRIEDYDGESDFERRFRNHLTHFVLKHRSRFSPAGWIETDREPRRGQPG
jgi:hypothetical protein